MTKKHGPKVHMFICTREKNGECCGRKGSPELREKLKNWVKDEGLKKEVKVTASLCLGECENGIAVCVYPDNEWLLHVDAEKDMEKLQQLIREKL